MFRLTAATRITLGLVCSMLGILMGANFLGLIPDYEKIKVEHRAQTLISLALSSAQLIDGDNTQKLEAVLNATVGREDSELTSAGLRNAEGDLIVAVGGHDEKWPADLNGTSTERFMQIAISAKGEDDWGNLEVVYTPLRADGLLGQLQSRMSLLLLCCAPVAFFSFRWFLTMVLKNLDPGHAIPRRVREALDILSEGLMIVGLNGRVLLANKATEVMTGHGHNEMVGHKAADLPFELVDAASSEDGSPLLPWMIAIQENTSIANVMMRLPREGRSPRIFRVNCSPLVGNDGKLRGVMVTFDDVTALEKNKVALQAAKDEADAANKAKSDFLANMSHEIRNPMNAIVGFTDILRRGMEENESTRRDYLNTIHASGTHLVGLINDILDLSKIESGKMEMEICDCSPYQLMNEVVNVMQMKAQEQNLMLQHRIEGTIPSVIQSDPTRLRQIMMNLVGNAIKFTQEGGVEIVTEIVTRNRRQQIQFSVIDTGIGMTEEQCSKVFEEFMQADSSVTRRFGGTGLGLAISKRLTEALGGEIVVSSVPDQGTTFTFCVDTGSLVGVEMVDDRQAAILASKQQQTQQAGLNFRFRPARVLVTDDTPANRQLVGLVLRKSGLEVEEAENGLQAVQKAASQEFDLMLMDMQMPVMDGFTATRKLREQGVQTPIFALTANVMQSDREKCQSAGCTGFLTKPIDIDQLLLAIAEVLPQDELATQEAMEEAESRRVEVENIEADSPEVSEDPQATIDDVMKLVEQALQPSAVELPTNSEADSSPLISTLPTEIPEFREIVADFTSGLPATVESLEQAWAERDFSTLRSLAHKLKGTGGTVGFADFTAPSAKLQELAAAQTEAGVEEALQQISSLAARVRNPTTAVVG